MEQDHARILPFRTDGPPIQSLLLRFLPLLLPSSDERKK